MMTSDQVFDAIEEIAATSSKNEKQALVAKYIEDELFKRVIVAALNPLITYGIAKRPALVAFAGDLDEFDSLTFSLLDKLATRALSGNDAIDTVQYAMSRMTEKSSELLWRIIKKDLRAGFSDSTVNKTCKGLIPEFPYMRCALPKDTDLAKWPWAEGVFSQEKADGMFANIDYEESGMVRITSRQGSEFPIEKFGVLELAIKEKLLPGKQYHGEIVVMREGKVLERQLGNGVLNSVLNGGAFAANEVPVYMVWDGIPLSAVASKGKYETSYMIRFTEILLLLKGSKTCVRPIPTKIVRSLPEAFAHYRELLKQGKEGTVIKHPQAFWKDGTSKEQIKLKLEVDVDLKVVGIVPGRADTKNEGRAGSLTCETSCGKLRVDVTVKNEAMRDHVDANPDKWIGSIVPVRANSILEPSESNELHSLFLPRMVEANYRTDKTEADDLQRVRDQFESAIAA